MAKKHEGGGGRGERGYSLIKVSDTKVFTCSGTAVKNAT